MGADAMSDLPPGFVLDNQPSAAPSLPQGFVLDKPGMAEDFAKSVGAGLGNQTLGVLGTPGFVREGLGAATSYLGDKLGFDADRIRNSKIASTLAKYTPTPEELRQTVTDPIVSPDYQPQTALGSAGKIGAEYSLGLADPAALASPAGLGRAVVGNIAVPAIAGEAANKLTEGTALNPYARVGAAFLGGVGASKALNAFDDARALKNATIPFDQLKPQTSAGYDAMTARNVAQPLAADTLNNLAGDIRATLNNKGIRPSNAESIHKALDEIATPATAGAPDVADLVASRQSIKGLLGAPDTNKAGAFIALDKIDKAIEQASPGTMNTLKDLDKNWAGIKANEALDKKVTRAELRAAGADSGLNLGNKIKQQITNLLVSKEGERMSDATRAQLQKVVDGTAPETTVRWAANLLGKGGGVMGIIPGEAIGHMLGGGLVGDAIGSLGGLAVGRGLNALNNRMVSNAAAKAANAIRRETPMGQQFANAQLGPTQYASLANLKAGVRAGRLENRRRVLQAAGLAGLAATANDRNQ